jgi:uncharacterized membrane protein
MIALLILSIHRSFPPRLPWRATVSSLAACGVLAGLELFFIDDSMFGDLERYNTYFKLSYPVWPVMMVVAAQTLLQACRLRFRPAAWTARALTSVWLLLIASYIVFGVPSRIARARSGDNPPRKPTLNAFNFFAHQQKSSSAGLPLHREEKMLAWIRENVPVGEAVAEGAWIVPNAFHVGAYDFHGRVASLAGHPVPLGWAHHERQWRGKAGEKLIGGRQAAIDAFYLAETPDAMRAAAAELGVQWALYGILEHDRYARRMQRGGTVLETLKQAAPLAAAFPGEAPVVFLFDFRDPAQKINAP